jgi:hypothetical protein
VGKFSVSGSGFAHRLEHVRPVDFFDRLGGDHLREAVEERRT